MEKKLIIGIIVLSILLISGISGCGQNKAGEKEVPSALSVACLKIDLNINSKDTFYNKDKDQIFVQISRGNSESELTAIGITVVGSNSNLNKNITENLPGLGEDKTYTIDNDGLIENPAVVVLVPIVEVEGERYFCGNIKTWNLKSL